MEKCFVRPKRKHQPLSFMGYMQRPLYQPQWHSWWTIPSHICRLGGGLLWISLLLLFIQNRSSRYTSKAVVFYGEVILLLRRHISTSGNILGCHKRGDATGIQWAEAKSAAEPLQFTGQPPHHGLTRPKLPTVLRLRNPDLKQRNSWTWLSCIHERK